MMGVSGGFSRRSDMAATYEYEVGFVAEPPRFADREHTPVELARTSVEVSNPAGSHCRLALKRPEMEQMVR
jgi:hypothetical protein